MRIKSKIGTCGLCYEDNVHLELSHFTPRFIAKAMKKASIEGRLRSGDDPTKEFQDTFKTYAFCKACEERMMKAETEFARRIYHPRSKGELREITYKEWLLDFCVSMAWRAIAAPAYTETDRHEVWCADGISVDQDRVRTKLGIAFRIWREYLLGKTETPGNHRLHLYVIHPNAGNNPALNAATQENMVVCVPNQTLVWVKIPNILILGVIEDKKPEQWRGTRVNRGGRMYFGMKEGSIERGRPETYQRVPQGLSEYFQREIALLQSNVERIRPKAGLAKRKPTS